MDWTTQRVIVTGGAGFLGSAIVRRVRELGAREVFVPRSREFDLTTAAGCRSMLSRGLSGCTVVIHAAGFSGGIGANRAWPARFFADNMLMGVHLPGALIDDGFVGRGGRFVQVGTMCAYPASAPLPYREESLFAGLPDADIASYGVAKLALAQFLRACHAQHGLHSAYCPLVNLYGPGDNIDDPKISHVAGALIKRFVDASDTGEKQVVCWGTGSPTRDFIFVDDAAAGLCRAAEVVTDAAPVNIASGQEVSIKTLATTIARLAGFDGEIVWDASKGDGVSRRCLDITRARTQLGWQPTVGLEAGLARTIAWYRAKRSGARVFPF